MSHPLNLQEDTDPRAAGLSARAHAKVNLHLGVGQARPDGYHDLVTVFQSLDIHDVVTLIPTGTMIPLAPEQPSGIDESVVASLQVMTQGIPPQEVPEDSRNLAWRAVASVAQRWAARERERCGEAGVPALSLPQVTIEITKSIPAAGGMAGGSADAAAALVLADALYTEYTALAGLEPEEIDALAANLGADVPFALHGTTMLGSGRGDMLSPMMARGTYHWALAISATGLKTPEVFAKLDEMRAKRPELVPSLDIKELGQALLTGDAEKLACVLRNDLAPAALSLRPDLRTTLEAGKAASALAGIVSGSGPTIAFLCRDEQHAQDVAGELVGLRGVTALVATSPAAGVEMVD